MKDCGTKEKSNEAVNRALLSSAKLCDYNKKSFEQTVKDFHKDVKGFFCEWLEGWGEDFAEDVVLTADERKVTFKTSITDQDTELHKGKLYMLYNTKAQKLTAVGFTEENDGYLQKYTSHEIANALKTIFDEYN